MCEALFRALTNNDPYQSKYLEGYGYDLGYAKCAGAMVGIFLFWLFGAWLVIWLRNRTV